MYRLFLAGTVIGLSVLSLWAADAPKDTPAAAATRKKLEATLSVDFKDTRIADVIKDLKEKVKDVTDKDISFVLDNVGGVSNNITITYKADNKTLTEILDEMLKVQAMGYIVVSGEYKNYKGRYDGWVLLVKGKERGYPPGLEAATKVEDKPKPPDTTTKTEDPKPVVEDADKNEMMAAQLLKLARLFVNSKPETAIERLTDIVKKYPMTKAGEEAKKLLADLKK